MAHYWAPLFYGLSKCKGIPQKLGKKQANCKDTLFGFFELIAKFQRGRNSEHSAQQQLPLCPKLRKWDVVIHNIPKKEKKSSVHTTHDINCVSANIESSRRDCAYILYLWVEPDLADVAGDDGPLGLDQGHPEGVVYDGLLHWVHLTERRQGDRKANVWLMRLYQTRWGQRHGFSEQTQNTSSSINSIHCSVFPFSGVIHKHWPPLTTCCYNWHTCRIQPKRFNLPCLVASLLIVSAEVSIRRWR